MAKILCTGIATVDVINEVDHYPHEDDEIRTLTQTKHRGGNATNTAVVLSQLGHQCYWAGTLLHKSVQESDSQFILDDLLHYHINVDYCEFLEQGNIPKSYITLSRDTGSRTIIHYRDLPEFSLAAFEKIDLLQFDWFHFEGRNIKQTLAMMRCCKQQCPDTPISLEIEKPRDNIDTLFSDADVLLFSRQYAQALALNSAQALCQHFAHLYPHKTITSAWGESGAGAIAEQQYYWQPAMPIKTVDTLAAGDVFNAAIIAQHLQQKPLNIILEYACQLAAEKCQKKGIAGLKIEIKA